MVNKFGIALLAVAAACVKADAIYTKNSPVLQVTAKNYDSLIAQSNYTSVGLRSGPRANAADRSRLSSFMLHGVDTART